VQRKGSEIRRKLERQWKRSGCGSAVRKACWIELVGEVMYVQAQVYKQTKRRRCK
jgi:hypothetical protein